MSTVHAGGARPYPVHVDADLDGGLSRWLWLVKWFLAIPHYLVLALLWTAFVVLSVVAFVAILFTGRYPRGIFDFNVGVLRWHWRVAYYAYAALGTDRYPPFTLADVPDYPAHLRVDYPDRLSRGLVVVKWLLALPHYLVTALFVGGGTWVAWQFGRDEINWAGGGLIGLLAFIAAVVLAVTGRYPRPIFDFVLGLDRWVLRVAGYAALMTDEYPPFRLDLGGHEDGATLTLTRPTPPDPEPPAVSPAPPAANGGWSGGRVAAVVIGSILTLTSFGFLGGGGALLWADQTQRVDGFVTSPPTEYGSAGYALATEPVHTWSGGLPATVLLGDVRVRVTGADPDRAVFVGVAPADRVEEYLAGIGHSVVLDGSRTRAVAGSAPAVPPGDAGIWTVADSGTGTRVVTVDGRDGRWVLVVMNADGSAGVDVRADIGATAPALPWLAAGLLGLGLLVLGAGVALIVVPAVRAGRPRRPDPVLI